MTLTSLVYDGLPFHCGPGVGEIAPESKNTGCLLLDAVELGLLTLPQA